MTNNVFLFVVGFFSVHIFISYFNISGLWESASLANHVSQTTFRGDVFGFNLSQALNVLIILRATPSAAGPFKSVSRKAVNVVSYKVGVATLNSYFWIRVFFFISHNEFST